MSEQYFRAIKFAMAGTAVAIATSMATDYVYQNTVMHLAPMPTTTTPIGQTGRQAFQFLAASTVAASGILLGEQVLTSFGIGDDPLFNIFYYYLCFKNMDTASAGSRNLVGLFRSVLPGTSGSKVIAEPGVVQNGSRGNGAATAMGINPIGSMSSMGADSCKSGCNK